jgi:glycosyltransferase involved in cell wall biosynthesis
VHNCGPLIYGGIAAHLCWPRPRVVYSEHNQIYSAPAGRKRRFRHYIRMADAIVTVSDDLRCTLARMGITRNVEVIYNGIDPQRFRVADGQGLRAELGVSSDEYLIGTAVVLTPQKGIEFLLAAIPTVLKQLPRARFMIAGDGYKKAELHAAAAALGVGDRLVFLGYRSDVPRFLNAMDLYVLPSLWEGLPLALIEALACGKPAVVSDVGGNREIVADGVNGRLVPPGDPEALARAIIETARDPRFDPAAVRDRNRQKFEALFSVDAMVHAHEECYLRAAQRAPFALLQSRHSEARQAG